MTLLLPNMVGIDKYVTIGYNIFIVGLGIL